jgi:hypothetical protein
VDTPPERQRARATHDVIGFRRPRKHTGS